MKRLRVSPLKALWKSCVAGALVFFLAGCGAAKKSEDGDEEANIGEYRISVSPHDIAYRELSNPTTTLQLSARCSGPVLPPDCGSSPGWAYNIEGEKEFPGVITIADARAAETTVTIVINNTRLNQIAIPFRDLQRTGLRGYRVRITFVHTRPIPRGLLEAGHAWVNFEALLQDPPTPREEQPADKTEFVIFGSAQRVLDFTLTPSNPESILAVPFKYTGPPGVISVTGPSDLGIPGSAGKFLLLTPSIPVEGKGERGSVRIQFITPDNDLDREYKASIEIHPPTGPPIPISLSGRRRT